MKQDNMRLPGLRIKPICHIAIALALAIFLSQFSNLNLSGLALAADDPNQTSLTTTKTAFLRRIEDLSKTSPTWRKTLSKHVFSQIDRELQSLEQQFIFHDSAKGKRFIKRVKVSLRKMKSGKQKFVNTGQETFLASFYSGRMVLEYNLWKLKNLNRDLGMEPDQSQTLYRIYALMNKWLVYVAHREINARRQGTSSPQTETPPTQDIGKSNAELQPVTEIATITEEDMEEADKALSLEPTLVQEITSNTGNDTLDTTSFSEEDIDFTETTPISNWVFVLIMVIGVLLVLFLLFRRKIKMFQLKDPFTNNIYDNGDSDNELITVDDFVTSEHNDFGIPNEDDSTHEYVARQIEAWTQENEEPVTASETIESATTQVTGNGFGEITQEDMAFQGEVAQAQENTLANKTLDTSNEIKENPENNVESLHDEEKDSSRVSINLLKQNHSLTEAQEIPDKEEEFTLDFANVLAEKDSLTNKLEILNTEKGELSQKLEHIHTEINSLTETLEASNKEKENLKKQLNSITAEKEDLSQKQDHLRTENDSLNQKLESLQTEKEEFSQGMEKICAENDTLTSKLETLHSEKEALARELENTYTEYNSLTKELEIFHTEKEKFAQELETIRLKNTSLTEKLEASHDERESLERQMESFIAEKEKIDQSLENSLTENNSLTKKLGSISSESETLKEQLKLLQAEKEEFDEIRENTLTESNSLTKELEILHAEKEKFAQELENIRLKNTSLAQKLETSYDERESLEKQLESITIEKEKIDQSLEDILAENSSLTKKMNSTSSKNKTLKQQLQNLHADKDELEVIRRKVLEKNDSLTKELETVQRKNKHLEQKQKNAGPKLKVVKKNSKGLVETQKIATDENEALTKELKAANNKIKKLEKTLENASSEQEALTKRLKTAQKKNKKLTEEQKRAPDEQETLMKELKAALKKIRGLEKTLKSTSNEQEASTKKLQTAQEKIKTITKKNKNLVDQFKTIQAENNQANELDPGFLAELQAMSVEVKDLKKKLESTSSSKDQESNLPEAMALETILEILRGFTDINKNLCQIAESRYTPSTKKSRGNSKRKKLKKS